MRRENFKRTYTIIPADPDNLWVCACGVEESYGPIYVVGCWFPNTLYGTKFCLAHLYARLRRYAIGKKSNRRNFLRVASREGWETQYICRWRKIPAHAIGNNNVYELVRQAAEDLQKEFEVIYQRPFNIKCTNHLNKKQRTAELRTEHNTPQRVLSSALAFGLWQGFYERYLPVIRLYNCEYMGPTFFKSTIRALTFGPIPDFHRLSYVLRLPMMHKVAIEAGIKEAKRLEKFYESPPVWWRYWTPTEYKIRKQDVPNLNRALNIKKKLKKTRSVDIEETYINDLYNTAKLLGDTLEDFNTKVFVERGLLLEFRILGKSSAAPKSN